VNGFLSYGVCPDTVQVECNRISKLGTKCLRIYCQTGSTTVVFSYYMLLGPRWVSDPLHPTHLLDIQSARSDRFNYSFSIKKLSIEVAPTTLVTF